MQKCTHMCMHTHTHAHTQAHLYTPTADVYKIVDRPPLRLGRRQGYFSHNVSPTSYWKLNRRREEESYAGEKGIK